MSDVEGGFGLVHLDPARLLGQPDRQPRATIHGDRRAVLETDIAGLAGRGDIGDGRPSSMGPISRSPATRAAAIGAAARDQRVQAFAGLTASTKIVRDRLFGQTVRDRDPTGSPLDAHPVPPKDPRPPYMRLRWPVRRPARLQTPASLPHGRRRHAAARSRRRPDLLALLRSGLRTRSYAFEGWGEGPLWIRDAAGLEVPQEKMAKSRPHGQPTSRRRCCSVALTYFSTALRDMPMASAVSAWVRPSSL